MKEKCDNCKHCNIHNKDENSEKISKTDIILYIVSIILFALSFLPIFQNIQKWICLGAIGLSGYKIIYEGIKNIFKFNFEEDTLMTIAVIAAFILGEFIESYMVIFLYKIGEFLEDKAVENSNDNIRKIVEIKAKNVNLIKENGEIEILDINKAKVGDNILIKPGELVPLDCLIMKGKSVLDMSSLTGESELVTVNEKENILSGSININGSLTCKVLKDYKNSTASQIVDLVEQAKNNKGKTENFITKFSKIYTPCVIIGALIIAIIPPLIFNQDFKMWILRALVFLVASCPCSIIISVPLAFFSFLGLASKKGLLIKGTKHIENLAKTKIVAFDKTGTITTGKMEVDKIGVAGNYSQEEILAYMYTLEKHSNHPISTAIAKKVEKENINSNYIINNYKEIPGYGIKAEINQKEILFGNDKLLKEYNVEADFKEKANYLAIDKEVVGFVTFKEEVRKEMNGICSKLKNAKIKEIYMLTGDNKNSANKIAKQVGITKIYAELLPKEKVEKVKALKKEGNIIFVGDGINDSPVLAEASFGISMGDATEIANNIADGILISNNIDILPEMVEKARKTIKIVKFNIIFSLLIKAIVLILGTLGYAQMWLAVVADTGVSLFTVLNSIRILTK